MPDMIQKYKLDHETYITTKQFCRNYPEWLKEYNSLLGRTPIRDGQPHGTGISDPVAATAMKMVDVALKLDAIWKPMLELPQAYQKPIFEHVVYKKPFPHYASISTWRRWQYKYIYLVAAKRTELQQYANEDY